jgi:hypothetical protein
MPSIAAAAAMTADMIFRQRCCLLMAPQVQSRINTRLTDVTDFWTAG